MQTFRCVARHASLRPKVCSIWSAFLANTQRSFFACSVSNKSSDHDELPNDSGLSSESESSENSKQSKHLELQKERLLKYMREWHRNRYETNAIWRDRCLASNSIYQRIRRATDQEWRNRKVENAKKIYYMTRDKPTVAIAQTLRQWIYHSPATREKLLWKTHIPILTGEKVERSCASCCVKRRGGLKLFWRRRQEPQTGEHLYDCSGCFFNNPAIRLPEGFEHVKTVDELRICREQLLGIKTRPYRWRTAPPTPAIKETSPT